MLALRESRRQKRHIEKQTLEGTMKEMLQREEEWETLVGDRRAVQGLRDFGWCFFCWVDSKEGKMGAN